MVRLLVKRLPFLKKRLHPLARVHPRQQRTGLTLLTAFHGGWGQASQVNDQAGLLGPVQLAWLCRPPSARNDHAWIPGLSGLDRVAFHLPESGLSHHPDDLTDR